MGDSVRPELTRLRVAVTFISFLQAEVHLTCNLTLTFYAKFQPVICGEH